MLSPGGRAMYLAKGPKRAGLGRGMGVDIDEAPPRGLKKPMKPRGVTATTSEAGDDGTAVDGNIDLDRGADDERFAPLFEKERHEACGEREKGCGFGDCGNGERFHAA
jgi:hypothetical protein